MTDTPDDSQPDYRPRPPSHRDTALKRIAELRKILDQPGPPEQYAEPGEPEQTDMDF